MRLHIVGEPAVGKTAVAHETARRTGLPHFALGHVFRALATLPTADGSLLSAVQSLSISPASPAHRLPQRTWLDGRELFVNERDLDAEATTRALSADRTLVHALLDKIDRVLPSRCVVEGRLAPELVGTRDHVVHLGASLTTRSRRLEAEPARAFRGTSSSRWLSGRSYVVDSTRVRQLLLDEGRWHCIATDHLDQSETVSTVVDLVTQIAERRNPRLTCIIPCHNEADSISQLVRELLSQRSRDDIDCEIVVVDDRCNDDTAGLAKRAGADLVLTNCGAGRSAARNTGLRAATGQLVLFLDGDTLPSAGALRRTIDVHRVYDRAVVLGSRYHAHRRSSRDSREVTLDALGYDITELSDPWILAYTCNLSIPTALARGVFFDEQMVGWGVEDVEWAYRIHRSRQAGFWVFDPARRVQHYGCDIDAVQRFSDWRTNRDRACRKHGTKEMRPLLLMNDLLDPSRDADLVETYRRIFDTHGGVRTPPATRGAWAAALRGSEVVDTGPGAR